MKIITSDKAYVQLQDISYLLKNLNRQETPASIIDKCFSNMLNCLDNDRYKFLEFDDPIEIEFFKKLDYSVDYLNLKKLSDDEIIEYASLVAKEKNEIITKFNFMTEEEKYKNMNLVREYELLEFKICSLRDILHFRQGRLNMVLPDDIEKDANLKKIENGIKILLKKFIRK